MQDLRVSLVQGNTIWLDPEANRAMYAALMSDLAGKTDLIVLPETFTSGFSNEAIQARRRHGRPERGLDSRAGDGSSERWSPAACRSAKGDGVFNRLLWATPDGELRHYDKRHLFRMAKEHERYAAGRDRLTVEFKGWRVCPLVCYDLRFPVFIRNRFDVEAAGRLRLRPAGFRRQLAEPAQARLAHPAAGARNRKPVLRRGGQPGGLGWQRHPLQRRQRRAR